MLRGHDRGPNGANRTRHTGLHAPVTHGGIGTKAQWVVHMLVCKSGNQVLDYMNVLVKRQRPVLRTIRSLMAGLGRVVPAMRVEPVMKFQAAALAADRGAMIQPLGDGGCMIPDNPCYGKEPTKGRSSSAVGVR